MDLLQLEHFLAVAEERSFTRAAQRVGRTQPAVSQSVKKLEDEVGAMLFARDTPEIYLTEAGRVLEDHARRMLAQRDEALRRLTELRAMQSGGVTVAAHEAAALYLLPRPLQVYLQGHPHIKVSLHHSRLADIPRQVLDRTVDIGFVKEEPVSPELEWVNVHADELVLVASPRHPLAARGRVRVRDLDNAPFVTHHLCTATQQRLVTLCEEHHVRCNIVAELWSFENIKRFVRDDVGLALVPGITVQDELQHGTLTRLLLPELHAPRRTVMIFRHPASLSAPARALVETIRGFTWPLLHGRRVRQVGPAAGAASGTNAGAGSAIAGTGTGNSAPAAH